MAKALDRNDDLKLHSQLLRIGWVAKICAWIVLLVNIALALTRTIELFNPNAYAAMSGGLALSLTELFAAQPAAVIGSGLEVAGIALRGIVYFLVLLGVSLGLRMIVETNLNYQVDDEEVQDE